jgi:hypothetical protein
LTVSLASQKCLHSVLRLLNDPGSSDVAPGSTDVAREQALAVVIAFLRNGKVTSSTVAPSLVALQAAGDPELRARSLGALMGEEEKIPGVIESALMEGMQRAFLAHGKVDDGVVTCVSAGACCVLVCHVFKHICAREFICARASTACFFERAPVFLGCLLVCVCVYVCVFVCDCVCDCDCDCVF